MNRDLGIGRVGIAGGIMLTWLILGCVGASTSADEDAWYAPREYYGAALEPKGTFLCPPSSDCPACHGEEKRSRQNPTSFIRSASSK